MQLSIPKSGWYVPAAHALHVALPAIAKVPASQGTAEVDPLAHADPAGHDSQSNADVPPAVERNVPASHDVTAAAPASQYPPAGHGSQLDAPPDGWYSPAEHGVQLLAPAIDALPGEQANGSADRSRQ